MPVLEYLFLILKLRSTNLSEIPTSLERCLAEC